MNSCFSFTSISHTNVADVDVIFPGVGCKMSGISNVVVVVVGDGFVLPVYVCMCVCVCIKCAKYEVELVVE